MSNPHHCFVVVDYGGQYTQLIARRLRELSFCCTIVRHDSKLESVVASLPFDHTIESIKGIVLSGGPGSVLKSGAPVIAEWVLHLNTEKKIPILGVCYGMQILAHQLGGKVVASTNHEYGARTIVAYDHSLFGGTSDHLDTGKQTPLEVWMSHGDRVERLPPGFSKIAESEPNLLAGMAHEKRKIFALQFHPEVTQTTQGKAILDRFAGLICQAEKSWSMDDVLEKILEGVRHKIKEESVILGLSGGVDSTVVAFLLQRAIGKRLTCLFIDTGLLRYGESAQVKQLKKSFGIRLVIIDAKSIFMRKLKGVQDPEKKRKVIGKTFIDVFENYAKKRTSIQWLAQGTIYSDVIESAASSGSSKVIKSHHNVGGLPKKLNLKVVEPLRELFKDEVRNLGRHLGVPNEFIQRHPFPGPGLAVRILGEIKPNRVAILQKADDIFLEELYRHQYYQRVSQAFVVLLPVKSVGVVGDNRRYGWVVALRAVVSEDFMTAEWAPLPYELLALVSNRIVNEIPAIARVVYDITGKPPATIEWE